EWCDAEILRQIRRKSLAKLRREVEPVEQHTLARFLTHWMGLLTPRRAGHGNLGHANLDALLDAIESLQGTPLPASLVESSILPARIADYNSSGLDTLIAAGEVAWAGVEPIGERDGRIALFLADKLPLLTQQRPLAEPLTEREAKHTSMSVSAGPSATEASHALALQLLNRYGVLLREQVAAENVPGGFSAVYDVLKALEESGRIRRGYFVAGLGATQFALPAAIDLLRQLRAAPPEEKPEFVQLAATDPANPYGSVLRWPDLPVA